MTTGPATYTVNLQSLEKSRKDQWKTNPNVLLQAMQNTTVTQ